MVGGSGLGRGPAGGEVEENGRQGLEHGQGGGVWGQELLSTWEVVHWCLSRGPWSVEGMWWGLECLGHLTHCGGSREYLRTGNPLKRSGIFQENKWEYQGTGVGWRWGCGAAGAV